MRNEYDAGLKGPERHSCLDRSSGLWGQLWGQLSVRYALNTAYLLDSGRVCGGVPGRHSLTRNWLEERSFHDLCPLRILPAAFLRSASPPGRVPLAAKPFRFDPAHVHQSGIRCWSGLSTCCVRVAQSRVKQEDLRVQSPVVSGYSVAIARPRWRF